MKVMGQLQSPSGSTVRSGDTFGTGEGAAPVPTEGGHASWGRRLRSLVLGPHGGGTTRRRASDAVRLATAVVLVVVAVPLVQANTSVELHVTDLLTPPPAGVRWLVTALWFLGSLGITVALVLVGLLVPRLNAFRQMALAAVATVAVCLLLYWLLGTDGGRPSVPTHAGFDQHFPVLQLAVATAVALAGLPYLSRPVHRLVVLSVTVAALCAVVGGYGLPLGVLAAIVVGWGAAAACHLALGAPNGLPSAAEVTDAVRDLGVDVRHLASTPRQEWGVAAFAGRDPEGSPLELAVYGRDAADAQWLSKIWRFCIYRDSGPTLVINRLQQVEHEAYLTFLAGHAGVRVPEVVAAGRCGPSRDAALVTRLPSGARRLASSPADSVGDDVLDDFLRAVLALRGARIAHGALSPETVVLSEEGALLRDFRRASSSAPLARTERDTAAAVAAIAAVAGVERAVAATCRVLDTETIRVVLTNLQRSALDAETERALRGEKGSLRTLRESLAAAAGVPVPKLVEAKRISWPNLLMVAGTLVGIWLIIGVLSDAEGSLAVIRDAAWTWVAAAFVLGQLPVVTGAWALTGAVVGPIPFGRCVALETSNMFTSFVGGDAAVFGVRVRFFQRQGLDVPQAISSGAIAGTASWVVKGLLFVVCIPFAAGDFHRPTNPGQYEGVIWLVIAVVLAVAIALAVATLVPKIRRLAAEKARPHLVTIWKDVKAIAVEPRKVVYVLAGSAGSQILIALCLGASLHSVGAHAGFATLVVVLTLAAMIGGATPVPGGAGVIEVGLIAGLTGAGIPQDQAVAAVFIERFCTAYLPPIWGWAALVYMRHSDYV